MSTKSSIAHGDNFHLYNEAFDDDNVHLELEGVAFDASNDRVTVAIPYEVWEVIRHKGAPDLSEADKTDDDILADVERTVNKRIADYSEAKDNDARNWVSLRGSAIFGGADRPRDQQVREGMDYYKGLRDRQRQMKDAIARNKGNLQ